MPVPKEYRTLAGHLARAWPRDEKRGSFAADYYPAYCDPLQALIETFALWSDQPDRVPTKTEFAATIDDLLFACKSADPHARSPIYQVAAEHLKAAAEEADRVLP